MKGSSALRRGIVGVAVLALVFALAGAGNLPKDPRMVTSVRARGGARGPSTGLGASSNGRLVLYESGAHNLVRRDTNQSSDIIVHDLKRRRRQRVSVGTEGRQAEDGADGGGMSEDGRVVVFRTSSGSLVDDDTSHWANVFVRDRGLKTTRLVSAGPGGVPGTQDSFLTQGSCVTADGRFAVFSSLAPNLVPGADNGGPHVFLADLESGALSLVSVNSDGEQGNNYSMQGSISPNGRYVAFESLASNLVSGDSNGVMDVFVFDRQDGSLTRASVASDGSEGDGGAEDAVVSDNGIVAFASHASNLVQGDSNAVSDIFVRYLGAGVTRRVSMASNGDEATEGSSVPSISRDGYTVAFESWADGLVPEDGNEVIDVFAVDLACERIRLLSANKRGEAGNGWSLHPVLSPDGTWCVFTSSATNFVRRDRNGTEFDVFLVRVWE